MSLILPFIMDDRILEHLHADARAGRLQTLCHVLLVPRFEPMCAHLLEEEGVYGSVKLHPLQLDLIPSDTDLLSMQCPGTFKTLQVYQDPSPVHSMVNALIRMEKIYGWCGLGCKKVEPGG